MSYQANQPGTELTPEEQLILAELASLGSPGQVPVVNPSGTGLEYGDVPAGPTGPTGGTGEAGPTGPTGPTGSGATPGGSDAQVQFNDAGAFGGDANLIFDKAKDALGVQASSPLAAIHVSSVTGSGIAAVASGAATLVAETLPTAPTGSVTNIAEPAAPASGSVSFIDQGSGAYQANGTTYTYRVYTLLDAAGIYYQSQYYQDFASTDPNDSDYYNVSVTWDAVSISGGAAAYYVEKDTGGGFSAFGVYGTNSLVDSGSGSGGSTTAWPSFYQNVPDTPPGAPSGLSQSVANEGFGTFSPASDGTTWYYEIDSYRDIGGTLYASGSPATSSAGDNNNGQSYDWQLSYAPGSPADGNIVRRSPDNASWVYAFVDNSGSYLDTGFSDDPAAAARWGQTYSGGAVQHDFSPRGIAAAPSGATVYSEAGATYSATIPADSVRYILLHSLAGGSGPAYRINAPASSPAYGAQTLDTYYDPGYTTWVSGVATSPTSYGFTGTSQNRDYRIYAYSAALGIYAATPLAVSTAAAGGSKYVSLSWALPSGITQVKIIRQVNGGGYVSGKLVTGSSLSDDSLQTWGDGTTVTPTAVVPAAIRADRSSGGSATATPAVAVIDTSGSGTRYPTVAFGVAASSSADATYQAFLQGNSSTGYLTAVTGRFEVSASRGGTPTAMFGNANIVNNASNSSIHFQVNGQNGHLFATRSDQQTTGFGQAIGSDQQCAVQIQPSTSGDAALVLIGHASMSDSSTLLRFQTSAGSYTAEVTLAGWFRASTGNATNPSFSCRSDTNTGVFFLGSDVIGVTTGGVERIRIDSGGNVGIGTTNITSKLDINQSSLGQVVLKYRSEATNDDPTVDIRQNRAATTAATVTTLHTVATVTNQTTYIEATVVCRRTGGSAGAAGDSASYKIFGLFTNVSGTVTLVGAVSTIYSAESQAGWDCTLTVSGTNVLVRVTGAANNNVTWHLTEIKTSQVGS